MQRCLPAPRLMQRSSFKTAAAAAVTSISYDTSTNTVRRITIRDDSYAPGGLGYSAGSESRERRSLA